MSFSGSHLPFAFCIYMESGARSLIQYQFNFHGVSSVPELSSGEQRLNYSFSRANSETGEVLNALPVYSTGQMLVLVTQVALQGIEGCAHSYEATGRVLQGSQIGKHSLCLPSVLLGLTALVGSYGRHDLGSQRKTEDSCILKPGLLPLPRVQRWMEEASGLGCLILAVLLISFPLSPRTS